MSDKEWKLYELEVADEFRRIYPDATVTVDVKIRGRHTERLRQIDVLVKNCVIDGEVTTLAIDAKLYKNGVDVKDVESFIGMLDDIGIKYGYLITQKKFSTTAIKRVYKPSLNIDLDILSLEELKLFQAHFGLPYASSHMVTLLAPFGWVVDATRTQYGPATLYQRGEETFEKALANSKAGMYVQFWSKVNEHSINDIPSLCEYQLESVNEYHGILFNSIDTIESNSKQVTIRRTRAIGASDEEIVGYVEFDDFIFFVGLICDDLQQKKNIPKLVHVLSMALPIEVRYGNKEEQ